MAQSTFYFNTKSTSNWTSSANMVDGTNTSYATTSSDGTTETLTGNTNNLSSGAITTVELRIYGFGDGDDTVVLTPRFNGSTNGDNYTITPTTSAAYSAWQNITSSTNAPGTWTFTDIDNLDCLVQYVKSGKADTMRVGIVELRVTYNVAPTVTTSAETSITTSGFTGNGNITDTGGVNPTTRGICVVAGTGTPTTSDTVFSSSGSFGTGTFSNNATGLNSGTTYTYRAFATNTVGTGYGSNEQVTTQYSLATNGASWGFTADSTTITQVHILSTSGASLGFTADSATIDAYPNQNYTYNDEATLPTDNTDLASTMTGPEKDDVASDDNTYFDYSGSDNIVKQFEFTHDNSTDEITVTWKGKTTLAPTSSTVYLQIYNYNTPGWETLDTDSATAADTEFTLTGSKTASLSNYYSSNVVTARVYQAVV